MGRPKMSNAEKATKAIQRIAEKKPDGFKLTQIPNYTEIGTTLLRKTLDSAVVDGALKVIDEEPSDRKNGLPVFIYAVRRKVGRPKKETAVDSAGDEAEVEIDPRAAQLSQILGRIDEITTLLTEREPLIEERRRLLQQRNEILDSMREDHVDEDFDQLEHDSELDSAPVAPKVPKRGKKVGKKKGLKAKAGGKKGSAKKERLTNHVTEAPRAEAAA